jgi:periplasmic protein TonB
MAQPFYFYRVPIYVRAVSLELSSFAQEDAMFADSLLESQWANRSHRGWTTLASFALQVLGVGILLLLPLIFSEGLPKLRLTSIGAPIGPPPGRRADAARHPSGPTHGNVHPSQIVTPLQVPREIARAGNEVPIPDVDACAECVPGGTGLPGENNPVPGSVGWAPAIAPPPPPRPTPPSPRVSVIMEGNLIYKVQPVYPAMARAARVQGAVPLRAIISRSGAIENLQVVGGHPLLVKAAIDAVRQWRYRPYILNGQPIEVETQVTVNFILGGG